jgi:transcriptional regulator with GAF, ATPase, and Fis domain
MAVHWLALARARLVLAGGTDGDLPADLEAARGAFGAAALAETAWRAELLAARIAQRADDETAARRHTEAAVALAEAQRARLPEAYRAQRERDPDAVELARLERSLAAGSRSSDTVRVAGRGGPSEGDAPQLRRLLEINKRLNQELRLPILLELVLDAVLELTDGERGFILLMNDADVLEVRIARNMDRQTLLPGELSLSQSIAEQAARQGEPVLTVDAAVDERFASAVSVHGLRLRSVLAVPLRVKGRVVGTVYVDNRLRRGAFQEGDLALVQDFAEQAAIALENARLHEALVAQGAEVAQLNEALAVRLEHQEAQIADMRTELRQSQAALRVRYDYSNIVGQTAKMQSLFHLLDRITDVDLPVVIHGESGTGSELVARAIHVNGPRKDRPFVSENCGAVPETLLESILFGHVRGAFTGADRDRRGLFEVADGGTLFLDEVGEMSPGMQTKLLRVLQEGELRRVGGDQVIRVDVRILAASNQRLDDLVAERRFRQDLYYRLNVLSVTLPPLRERVGDIPLLVDHFVRKHSADRPRRIARPALERLMVYAWPGNVRELENELQRALALGGDVIGEADLSAPVRGAGPTAMAPDDLDLRARVEHLERELLERALERTRGNQTKAAQLLGLSRFGLLKKLRRYELLPRTGDKG